jgi:serine/threonine protein kinase
MILPPDTLVQGRYRVVRSIGQGNMGAVYEAYDEHLAQRVALKQTLTSGDQFSKAFEREAKILAGLRHPVLPIVIDHFTNEEGQFMVMDYIPGQDLGSLLKQRGAPFMLHAVLIWADQVLHALEYMHRQQPPIIHRDIKPQNLKLTAEGQVVLLDFGLAKGKANAALKSRDYETERARRKLSLLAKGSVAIDPSATSSDGFNTDIFGFTRQYAPLEQIQATGTDPRSDIYALGATLYHLLTGRPPDDVLKRITARGYDKYSHYEAGLDALISKMPQTHHLYKEARACDKQLRENIDQARLLGDNPTSQNERSDTIDRLGEISYEAIGIPFHKLCRLKMALPTHAAGTTTNNTASTATDHADDTLPPIHELNSLVPVSVSTTIHQALALDPDDRPPTAAAMRARLNAVRKTIAAQLADEYEGDEIPNERFLPPHPPAAPGGYAAGSPDERRVPWPVIVIILVIIAQFTLVVLNHSERAPSLQSPAAPAAPTTTLPTPAPPDTSLFIDGSEDSVACYYCVDLLLHRVKLPLRYPYRQESHTLPALLDDALSLHHILDAA